MSVGITRLNEKSIVSNEAKEKFCALLPVWIIVACSIAGVSQSSIDDLFTILAVVALLR